MTHNLLKICLGAIAATHVGACGLQAHVSAQPRAHAVPLMSLKTTEARLPSGVVQAEGPLEQSFSVQTAGEGLLDLTASVPGADWQQLGSEAATIRLYLDGQYNQDVILVMGDQVHPYALALGPVTAGEHTLRFERLDKFSAPGLRDVRVHAGDIRVVPPTASDYAIFAQAPIILGREDCFRTDAPLITFHDVQPLPNGGQVTRYTTVFTNEDGGTATRALMARWGRTLDIDWSFASESDAQGKVVRETYQGRFHLTKGFQGKREGGHPILRVSTSNNTYDDEGASPLKFRMSPAQRHDPALTAREEMLDLQPWTYGLSSKELFREHKATQDFHAPAVDPLQSVIGDPRHFVFFEFRLLHQGRNVAAAVKLKNYAQIFTSHRGDDGLAVSRSGWVRVAVELPRAATFDDIERLELLGVGRGTALVTDVRRVMVLDKAHMPAMLPITWNGDVLLKNDTDRVTVYQAANSDPIGPERTRLRN